MQPNEEDHLYCLLNATMHKLNKFAIPQINNEKSMKINNEYHYNNKKL